MLMCMCVCVLCMPSQHMCVCVCVFPSLLCWHLLSSTAQPPIRSRGNPSASLNIQKTTCVMWGQGLVQDGADYTHLNKQCMVPGKVPSIGHADAVNAALPHIGNAHLHNRSQDSSRQAGSQQFNIRAQQQLGGLLGTLPTLPTLSLYSTSGE